MAGTDTSRGAGELGPAPAVVLVRPQMGENIGATARAMLNCGLTDLRLVAPRDHWPNERAVPAASGADAVLDSARVFATTADAVADLARVFAATVRHRDMVKPVVTPRRAAAELRTVIAGGATCGVMFGPERSGLDNDDLALADTVMTVPLNPAFGSLNLAQAVLILAYEWFQAADDSAPRAPGHQRSEPASKAELMGLFEHLEFELDAGGFLHPPEKRPSMVRNLRNIFQRAELLEHEVRTLRGVVAALTRRRDRG